MKMRWIKIAGGAIALILLIAIAVPLFIHADAFRPVVENRLSSALGRKVTLGKLSFSLFSGSLDAHDISIADDPNYSGTPFIQAKTLAIGVEVGPLLFHRQVHITRLTIDSPSIHLIQAANGLWNFSSIGVASPSKSATKSTGIPDLTVAELNIKNGSAAVSAIPAVRQPFVYSNIDLTVKNFSFLASFPFELSATLPADGTLSLKGNAGPFAQKNAAATPFKAKLSLKRLNPVAAGLIEQDKGISMVLGVDSDIASDGVNVTSSGKIGADKLQLAHTGKPTTQTVNIDYSVSENLARQDGKIASLSVNAGSAAAYAYGTYQFTPQAVILNLHLKAPNMPIDQLQQLLPAFGVELPSGSQLRGGTLSADLSITGPATATTIRGPVDVENTTLAGFDLGSKIQGLNLFKSGSGTQIQSLKATVNSAPQITLFNDIYGNLPQLGTATGTGSVTPAGALDFKMIATLSNNNAVGSAANQAMNQVSNYIGGFLHPNRPKATGNTARGIPINITGTASNPKIRANVVAMLK
ncbi:MAG: AsmA family protein [Acidobacteriota bacterium]|nr:AsmA family protein [Acidobacteriota bacterium]